MTERFSQQAARENKCDGGNSSLNRRPHVFFHKGFCFSSIELHGFERDIEYRRDLLLRQPSIKLELQDAGGARRGFPKEFQRFADAKNSFRLLGLYQEVRIDPNLG